MSKLAWDGIRLQSETVCRQVPVTSKYGLLPRRDEVVTCEHVRDLMDQEGI